MLGGSLVVALAALWFMLSSTNPATVHPLGILAVFGLFYIVIVVMLTVIIYQFGRLVNYVRKSSHMRSISIERAYLYGSVLALAPVILLAMQSVGATDWIDIMLVVLFEVLACFYIWRRS